MFSISENRPFKLFRDEREERKEGERRQRKLVQLLIQWILRYGTEKQKQTLLLMMENQELQRLREVILMDIFLDFLS